MLNKLIKIINYLSKPDNWCEPEDRAFYKLYLWFVCLTSYILIGTYLYDQEMLKIFFWPFNNNPFK